MEKAKLIIVPTKFAQSFKQEIKSIDPTAKIGQQQNYFEEIYTNSFNEDKKNQIIQSKLAEIGLSDQKKMSAVLKWLQNMILSFNSFDQFMKDKNLGDVSGVDSQKLIDWKFEIFIHKKYMNQNSIIAILDKLGLEIKNPSALFSKAWELINIIDFQSFQNQIKPTLAQVSDIQKLKKQNQAKAYRTLYHRNLCFQQLKLSRISILLQNKALQVSLDILYQNISIDQTSQPEAAENQADFFKRVFPIMCQLSGKFECWNEQQQKQLIDKLHKHTVTLDKNQMIQTLLKSGLKVFDSKDKIKDDILVQIYNLSNASQLKIIVVGQKPIIINQIKVSPSKAEGKKVLVQQQNQWKDFEQQNIKKQYEKYQSNQKKQQKNNLSPQEQARRNQYKKQRIIQIQKQIKEINQRTNNKQCIERIVRQLQIALYQENSNTIRQKTKLLRKLINKYKIKSTCLGDIDEVEQDIKTFWDRVPKINTIKKKTFVLNLVEVFQGKVAILGKRTIMCKDANAILIIGRTGAGKSTLMTALSGTSLVYVPGTKDYRASNPAIAELIPVSNKHQWETRSPNVFEVGKNYSKLKGWILIDTPGFEDNRGQEMQITNNLGTVNLIKTLKTAKILIVLPKEQFYGARQLQGYTKFIKLFSNYFFSVADFSSAISVILTKGLTAQQLLSTINQIESTKAFKEIDWTQNQTDFQKMLKKKLKQLKQTNQIQDPSKHDFEQLVDFIAGKLRSKQLPGEQIQSTFSPSAISSLKQAYSYLQKMVCQTFQQGQFLLTQFYLNNIKELQEVYQSGGSFNTCKNQLKQSLQKKVKHFQVTLERFLLSNNDDYLNQLKQLVTFFNNPQSEEIYNLLYFDKQNNLKSQNQKTPKQLCQTCLQQIKKKTKQIFVQNKKIDAQKRKRIRSSLKLMKQFGYQNQYEDIKIKIQNQVESNEKAFKQILQENRFNEGQWKNTQLSYINQFRQDEQTNTQKQKFEGILQIILNYINSSPKQLEQIDRLLECAMTKSLDSQLESVCTLYLNKLTALKQRHYIIKQALEPKIKQIFYKLDSKLTQYEQKKLNNKTININDFEKWQIFAQNSNEIHQIKSKFSDSQMLDFTNRIQQQSMLTLFFNNLSQNIQGLQKLISVLPQNPSGIDPDSIRQKLQTIFCLLSAMQKKKSSQPLKQENSKKLDHLVKILQNSYRKINTIINTIQRTCNTQMIRNYELNLKLINSITVIQQFKDYVTQDKMKKRLQTIQINIKNKILSPLQNFKKDQFKDQFSFEKLLKILKYMKRLDEELKILNTKTESFQFLVHFHSNSQIQEILDKCFSKIKDDFKKFQPIRQLSLHGAKNSLGSSKTQQLSKMECIDQMNFELLQKGIKYIKCFEFIKQITKQFWEELNIVEDFKKSQLEQSDLKTIIKQRINTIASQLKGRLQITDIELIKKEFIFLNRLHEKTKSNEEIDYYQVEQKIELLLKNLGKGFDSLYDEATSLYRNVQNKGKGVQYQTLRQLQQHEGISVGDCNDRFKQLLRNIDQQYSGIMTTLFIQFDPKSEMSEYTDIFLNIFQFINICKQRQYIYRLDDQLLTGNLENFFSQLQHGFDKILDDFRNGIPIVQKKVKQLGRYEKKILLFLRNQYRQYKHSKGIKQNLVQYFEKQKKQIQQNTIGRYVSKEQVVFDQNYQNIYENTTPKNRQQMKKIAIQKNMKDLEVQTKLVQLDHQKLEQFFAQKFKELENMPTQISQVVFKQFVKLDKKRKQIQDESAKHVTKSIELKDPSNILNCFVKGQTIKNKKIKQEAVQGVKKYFKQQQSSLDLNNLQNFQKILVRNIEFAQKPDFKNISKNQTQLNHAYSHFITQVKSRVHERNKGWQKDIKDFKKKMLERIRNQQQIEIHNIKLNPNEQKIITSGKEIFSVVNKFQQHMNEQVKQLKTIIEKKIEQENTRMIQSHQQIEKFKKRFVQKQNIIKEEFIKAVTQAQTTRQTCNVLSQFNKYENIQNKVQEQQIQKYDRIIQDLKEDLRRKYQQAMSWNLQEFINNQSVISNSKQNQENQRVLDLLNNLKQVFFSKTQMADNIIQTIQLNTKNQFQEFQKKVLDDIDLFFRASVQCESQRVSKYYKLISKLKQGRSIRFPLNMKIDNKVKDKLINKFKGNVRQIQCFIQKDQKVKKYQAFKVSLKKVNQEQLRKIKQLKEQTQNLKKQEEKTLREKLQVDKQAIPEQQENRGTKVQGLQTAFKADLQAKYNDCTAKQAATIKTIQQESIKAKQKINVQLTQFLQQQIVKPLTVFQRANTFFYCEDQIKRSGYSVKSFFDQIQRRYRKDIFRLIYPILTNSESPHSQALTSQKCFESISQSKWRDLVSGATIDTLMDKIDHLKKNSNQYKLVINRYATLEEIYARLTEQYKKAADFLETKKRLVQETKSIAAKLSGGYKNRDQCTFDRWELVSRICALWTIQKSELDEQNNVQFIHKPHPGQILAIFLLLQFDEKSISKDIKNTMVQVSTGEGKSVILGIMSTYLALVGFTVYEACFSTYLSERDYNDFVDLFELFGIKDKIFYKTFPEICRMMLNESPDKPFAAKVQKLIVNPSIWDNFKWGGILPKDRKSESILLIDEADAFLDEKYLGQSFFPSINIKKGTVKKLLDFVWGQRQNLQQLTPSKIINSIQFNDFCNQITNENFKKLMENQANAMVRDLNTYKDDSYTLIDGKIFYKSGDSLSDKIHYGYRTIFSYYHEYYIGKRINEIHLNEQIVINLIVASFSFSKLPFYFASILGVTGILKCMSEKQKQILTDRFKVKRLYEQNSIYPPNRRVVNFYKCNEQNLLQKIVDNIEEQNSKKRPIVIFFKTKAQVYHFYNSGQFSRFRSNATIVTHEVKPEDRKFRIQMSTTEGKITLLTVDFGRGTDFKLKVKNIDQHPGLHVICAFLPQQFSDYLQLIGRTGRQGKNGSVKFFILQDSSLPDSLVNREQAQQLISKLDNDHWNGKIDELNDRMKKADSQHEESTLLYSSGSNADKIFQKMQIFNKQQVYMKLVSRTVIGIDATVSMGLVFSKLIPVILTALPKISDTIKDAKVQGTFQIKWVIYRNYNSTIDQLISYSSFENKCEKLVEWIKQINVSGGWQNQALEVCLNHINSLPNANQYVIISDAKGHQKDQTKDQIMFKRSKYHGGDNYWTGHGIPYTNVEDEIAKLNEKKVKGHFYYLNKHHTEAYYKKLALMTGGVAQQLKIDEENSTQLFTDFIAKRILTNLGELVGGNAATELLEKYTFKARAT